MSVSDDGSTPSCPIGGPRQGQIFTRRENSKNLSAYSRLFWRYSSTAASSRKSKIMDQSILVTSGFQFKDDGSTPSIASELLGGKNERNFN